MTITFSNDDISLGKKKESGKTNYCREIVDDYCVIDTETTGTSIYYDEVIEIGALKIRDDIVIDTFQTLVKPQMSIPRSATIINNITDDMVINSPTIDEVIDSFLSFIGDDVLVGQNTSFDINILNNNANCDIDNKYVCIEQMVKKLWQFKDYKLDTMREEFAIKSDAHRALGDCEATNIIYNLIKNKLIETNTKIEDYFVKKNHSSIRINDIEIDPGDFDEDSPVYDRSFAFTGTLPFARDKIIEDIIKIGGHCHNKGAIAKDTEFLVIGADFYKQWKETGNAPSSKVEKALENGIEILDSDTFMNMIYYK